MKLDEDLGRPDREDSFLTDDEENQAELACSSDLDDSESSNSPPYAHCESGAIDISTPTWPQSYRESMDMYTSVTPSFSFLTGITVTRTNSLSSLHRRRQDSDLESSLLLDKPLVSEQSIDKEEVPTSTLPGKVSSSSQLRLSGFVIPATPPFLKKLSSSGLRPAEEQCSVTQSVLNGINVLCGIGLLTTPYAVKEGGWLSLFLLLFYAIITCYTGILLKRCLESSPGLHTYPDIGQAAFGLPGRLAISILLYVELYAACVEYVIMMSDNLSRLFPHAFLHVSGINLDPHQLFSIVATLFVLPTVYLRDLSLLSYLSVGGVVSSILIVLCLLWIGVVDQVGFHSNGTALDITNLSVAIGIYGFGFSGHSVFPNIYSSMKEPSKFPMVLLISFAFCWFLYTGVAICGFLMFGDSIESQFTLNMPKRFFASKVGVWTAVVIPLSKYAITLTPISLSLEELLPSAHRRSHGLSVLIRTGLVISTLVVAQKIPLFAYVMALIGSLLAMLVAIIFPCACYLSLLNGRLTKLQIALCSSMIVVGFVSACCGTYSSIARMADALGR